MKMLTWEFMILRYNNIHNLLFIAGLRLINSLETDDSVFRLPVPVADPGFPFGGADLQHVCFSVKMYVKMKELDPVVGGGGAGSAPWIRQWV